ncbi:hypothetical protein [Kitasatospora camelliae]|uniref:hypothetical protein n=1 Tax=Kitasatospora camelliae TaxID=3156397 RepID=UPI00339D20D1
MRRRWAARLAVLIATVGGAAACGLGGGGGGDRAEPAFTATPVDPCVRQLTDYLQQFLDGGVDLGDYQELGLSSSEATALRGLRREAADLRSRGPLPPDWVSARARASCAEIARAESSATPKPPGWP